jgi:hypothetical protein
MDGEAKMLRENEDVKEFYLGVAEGNKKSFREVKSYKRRKRWLSLFQFGAVVALLGLGVVVHLLTLPVEFDASFGKALPILDADQYLHRDDMPAARGVLRAAAMTYVAASLMGLLDFLRILRVFR